VSVELAGREYSTEDLEYVSELFDHKGWRVFERILQGFHEDELRGIVRETDQINAAESRGVIAILDRIVPTSTGREEDTLPAITRQARRDLLEDEKSSG